MIHYHGTPINPVEEQRRLAGKNFCVSMSDARYADWCLTHGQSVMWDSGAYGVWRNGGAVDWLKYYDWIKPRVSPLHWAVVPDVIGGTVEQQRELVSQWPYPKVCGAPVWHMDLPLEYLTELAQAWPRICFGSTKTYGAIGCDAWERRCDEAWNTLQDALGEDMRALWVHMLRGMALSGDRWPFLSVDSVSVAINHRRDGICPERMARRWDSVQSPIRWYQRSIQRGMF